MSKSLLTLQTDLKSLRYGSDKPYVTKDVNNPPTSNQTGMQVGKRIDDLSRITQMFVDRPGLKYLANEALLQQIGAQDKISKARKGGKSVAGAILQQAGRTAVSTVKIIGSTLGQVAVNGTGTHFVKGFRTDTYLQPSGGNTRSGFAQFFGAGGVEGAPLALRGEEIKGKVDSVLGEPSGVTGVFKPNPSSYDYTAKVNVDNNEGQNKPIPEWASKEFYNSTLASQGKVIPVSKTESRPVQAINADTGEATTLPGFDVPFQQTPKVETTLTSGSLGISNKDIEGDITQVNQPNIKPFKEEDQVRKSKNNTESNIIHALTGSAIPLTGSGIDTTATPGGISSLIKSISNKNLEGITTIPSDNNIGNIVYTQTKTYTGNTSQSSINNAIRGKRIRTNSKEKSEEAYLRNYTLLNTDGTSEARVENVENIQGEVQEEKKQESTIGEKSIPNRVSLATLRAQINTGSIDTVEQLTRTSNQPIQDFRSGSSSTYSFDYNNKSIKKELRIDLGDQGAAKKGVRYGDPTDVLARDGVNYLDVRTSRTDGSEEGRDLAKFFFEVITPSAKPQFLYFRAFIDSIDDNYSADWQAHKYIGRAENFYTYGGFDRDINISFNIAAATRSEMRPLYRKMVYLASTTAPTYGGENNFMRGTVVRLTLGSYFSQIPGVITSVKYTVDNNAPWEIAMANPEAGTDDDVQELPMVLKCSISFKPIHDFAPQTGLQHYFTNPVSVNGSKPFF